MTREERKNINYVGVAVLLVAFIVMCTVYPKKPKQPYVYGPEWNPVFDFVQTADKVETVATTYGGFEFDHPPADILATLTKYDPNGHHSVQVVPSIRRGELVKLLKKMPNNEGAVDACFCPHHYIRATKGAQQIIISMCFSCGGIGVGGALKASTNLRRDTADDTSKFFGLDVFPYLDKKCYINTGTYDPGMVEYGINGPANPAK